MLIARWNEEAFMLRPLVRRRSYVRLAQDFEAPEARTIKAPALDRAVRCLKEFSRICEAYDLSFIRVVATGVLRDAVNRDEIIRRIGLETNLPVELLSGEEEARLTGLGITRSIKLEAQPFITFDLGGGSTEFLLVGRESLKALSVPLGAALLTERYLVSDPPSEEELGRATTRVTEILGQSTARDFRWEPFRLIGTGGTVTTLAAMDHGIGIEEIGPERMNGLVLERSRVAEIFSRMKDMGLNQRLRTAGLDPGRAEVIIGGTLAVLEILKYFDVHEAMVSVSDLLEGVLFERLGYSLP
jgi:exopolyphosphatase / guanosine-5'-triphosphate,3'-diphosphate pyrophosphatase